MIKTTFLKGLLAVVPITATIYLLIWLIKTAESAFGGILMSSFPNIPYVPGLGVLIAIVLIFLIGLALNAWITQKVFQFTEDILEQLPLIKSVYKPMKDLMGFFSGGKTKELNRVVLVDLKEFGQVLGLVTRDSYQDLKLDNELGGKIAVFIPLSYQIGGMTLFLPKEQIQEVDLPVEKALNLAVTGWIRTQS